MSTPKRKANAQPQASKQPNPKKYKSEDVESDFDPASGRKKRLLGDQSINTTSHGVPHTSTKKLKMNGKANNSRKKPVKKLVIKGFEGTAAQLPNDFEEKLWEKLQLAIRAVHLKEAVKYGEEELYKATENLCTHKLGGSLYKKIQDECEIHIKTQLNRLLSHLPEVNFLVLVNSCWKDHCESMFFIRSIFLYLDRTYVLQTPNVISLWDMGLKLFRDHIATCKDIEQKTVSGILDLIETERNGETIDRALVKSLVTMFIELQIYVDTFEPKYLLRTGGYYKLEGNQKVDVLEVPEYLQHIEARLHEEEERIAHYLSPNTRFALLGAVQNHLIRPHVSALLTRGLPHLVDAVRLPDLSRAYYLFGLVQALPDLAQHFLSHVKKVGSEIVLDEQRDKAMVQNLLDFRGKLDIIFDGPFKRDPAFAHAIKEAFEYFINVRQNRPAELIAKYIDSKLKRGNKGQSEEEMEAVMDKVMVLFRYINGKDVFEAFYKKDLAKRLLLNKSASFDSEKSMISKLKTECGSGFTSKLEGMFKDMDLSKDIMNEFRLSNKHANALGKDIDMNVSVLTTGYWPHYPPLDVNLPTQLAEYQEVFRSFYVSKYSGRRLFWQNSLGHTVLKAHFAKQRKELSVSLFQTVILLLFNDSPSLSYRDIRESTRLEESELKRTLLSLACGRVRPLHKKPQGKDVNEDDVFHFNNELRHKLYRIKINSIQMKETPEENKKTTEGVFQDRQYQIDAAVVRIMKTRKQLTHTLLMAELYKQLKFPLKAADVKKRIESLIDREYLERDASSPATYNYLA